MLSRSERTPGTDYGVDAPKVMRIFFLAGFVSLLCGMLLPRTVPIWPWPRVDLLSRSFFWPAGFFIGEGLLFLLYVKFGKFRHRDMMLSLHAWRGDEQVLDVGCGRGLLLAGAARRLVSGHATGIDVWSNEDMGGNSPEATERNLQLEGVADHCDVVSAAAEQMPFADGHFDVILSNLCLHNIYNSQVRTRALQQIVRVLKPGGIALISDYKLTGEYSELFRSQGLQVTRRWGSFLTTFPPLRVVIARKPG